MSSGINFNINNSGQVGQQNIGQSGGEAKADVTFNNGGGITTPVQWVDAVEQKFIELVKAPPTDVAADPAATPASPEELEAELNVAKETFTEMRALASVEAPAEPEVKSVMSRFGDLLKSKGPQIGKALAKAALAGLQATVATHPAVAAGMALLSAFTDES